MDIKTQRIIISGLVSIIVFFIVISFFSSSSDTETSNSAEEGSELGLNPIKQFLPSGGVGAACTESVGVILEQGFGAKITINGKTITPEELNVNLNPDGSLSNKITASRSTGEYSFEPSPNCPKGNVIRPNSNLLAVCVYKLSDKAQACVVSDTFKFDAI